MGGAMSGTTETSDIAILDLLRKVGPMGVSDLAASTRVTPTAVRQRLTRLMSQGMIDREVTRAGRGRPSHRYQLTDRGRRQSGANFVDLALALWKEIRSIEDQQVRKGLLQRIARHLADMYASDVRGATTAERMESVRELFAERKVPFEVEARNQLPVLTVVACPYPELAEADRGICALERMLFSELLGTNVKLSECRLDGANCCSFETN